MTKRDEINANAFDDSPPSEEEVRASERLRDSLDRPNEIADPSADFARAIAIAHDSKAIDDREHRAIVDRALAPAPRMTAKTTRSNVVRVTFGIAASLAIAATFVIFAGSALTRSADKSTSVAAAPVALVQSRSTESLFAAARETTSGSARIDRIAMARENDLRENRFAMWGVR